MTDPVARLDYLIHRGRGLIAFAAPPAEISRVVDVDMRVWLRECGETITELAGGSKAHWLARAFSEAFLVRSAADQPTADVPAAEIIERLVAVLERARASIVQAGGLVSVAGEAERRAHRFEFVHRRELRPVLEQAYLDAGDALDAGRFGVAFLMSCSVLDAIVTDALEAKGLTALTPYEPPEGAIATWPFAARVAVAERAGLIRRGCSRLPNVAWEYREIAGPDGTPRGGVPVSERDARIAGQVLNVIMRDLDPGR